MAASGPEGAAALEAFTFSPFFSIKKHESNDLVRANEQSLDNLLSLLIIDSLYMGNQQAIKERMRIWIWCRFFWCEVFGYSKEKSTRGLVGKEIHWSTRGNLLALYRWFSWWSRLEGSFLLSCLVEKKPGNVLASWNWKSFWPRIRHYFI